MLTTDNFTWNKAKKTLSAEASSLPEFSAKDAIKVLSTHTGKVVTFILVTTEKDLEGDTLFWEYIPVGGTVGCKKLTVFND